MNDQKRRRRAVDMAVDQEAAELVIQWQDGHTSRFPLAQLRRNCPCANCREAREEASSGTSINMLEGDVATATAEVRKLERVGRYALRITWADGHDYGIYPLEALRASDDAGREFSA